MEKEKEKKALEKLPPRPQGSTIVGFLKKLSWRSLACVCTYVLGYFNFSIAWMVTPLILSALRDQYKKDKRQRLAAARETALTNEQAMIESRMLVEDLPSWVYFPDKERAEWINNIIKQLWPNLNNYVRKTLFETVEPLVKNILHGYKIKGFKFERDNVHLGQIPPRITGIKVYDHKETSRNEIIMDMDLVFASDLEVVFSLKGIKAKVSEFSLRGMLRVVLKPLISEIPLIGGVQVYFMADPEIDYSLGGVAGALDVPGLGKIVENIVQEQVRNFIVLPNKFFMPLVATIPKKDLICPNTAGVLRVTLLCAKDLMQKDVALIGKGKSDPYVILTVGATTYKTPTQVNSLNPTWNLTYDFPIEVVHGQEFMMEFFDEDNNKDDEFLGRATVQTGAVAERGQISGFWVDLEECDSGKAQVSLSWLPVTKDPRIVRELAEQDDENAKCVVHIYIDSCTGLDNVKNPAYKPSPLVQITCVKEVRQTWPKSLTNSPVVEQGFVMLANSPHSDDIHIKILDTGKQNSVLGTTSLSVWDIIQEPGMEYPLQPWLLKGSSPDAKVVMSVSVRGLKRVSLPSTNSPQRSQSPLVESPRLVKSTSVESCLSYDETVRPGTIALQLYKAVDLEKKDVGGKSDPYATITYENQESTTEVCKNTLAPEWNHEEIINIRENGDNQIQIKIMDRDKIGKDDLLGITWLDVRRVSHAGEISQVWDVLTQCKTGKILLSAQFTPSTPAKQEAVPSTKSEPEETDNQAVLDDPNDMSVSSPDIPDDKSITEVGFNDPEPEIDDRLAAEAAEDSVTLPAAATLGFLSEEDTAAMEDHNDTLGDLVPADSDTANNSPGFLHVTVHRAIELEDKDMAGKSDPYVNVVYEDHVAKSQTHKNNLNPEFDFTESFVVSPQGSRLLKLELFDKDIGDDEFLGRVEVDLSLVLRGEEFRNHWVDLVGCKSGKILLSVWFTETQPDTSDQVRRPSENNIIAAAISPAIGLVSPGIDFGENDGLRQRSVGGGNGRIRLTLLYEERNEELKVFVHEAAGLPGGDLPDPPDPYVKVYLMPGKKKKKKTNVVKDSGSPRFDEEFDFDISFNKVKEHYLKVSVMDKKGVFAKSPVLGMCEISLDNHGLTQGVADWFPLHHDDDDSD